MKLAIVTGTSAGIGEALTSALLGAGWDVIGIARRPVHRIDPRYTHLAHDLSKVSDWRSLESALKAALASHSWDRLGLVNNAATQGQMRAVERLDAEAVLASLALNVVAPLALMGFCERVCRPQQSLRVVNVTSLAATAALPGVADYCAGKAGLRLAGMVLGTEAEASKRDLAILSYNPGTVDTAMHDRARAESPDDFPSSAVFHHFQQAGMLVAADRVVRPMVEFLEGGGPPGFHEFQYEGGA